MRKEIDRMLGNSLRCILPSYWWKRLLGKMADRIESAEESAASASRIAMLAGREASDKQPQLVSGSNIKTICGNSILGSGDITPDPSMKVYIPMGGTLSSYSKSYNQSFYRRVRDGGNWVNSWRAIAVTASANKEVVLLGVSYNTTQGCRILISGFQEEDITDKYECVLLEDGSVSSVTKAEGESGGSSITVDSEVSETSENPVQNKAIKAYVDERMANVGGSEIREFYTGDSLTEELKAWNLETFQLFQENKCFIVLDSGSGLLPLSWHAGRSFVFQYGMINTVTLNYEITVSEDGSTTTRNMNYLPDEELSTTSANVVSNSVITAALNNKADKTYVDEKVANVDGATLKTINGVSLRGEGNIELHMSEIHKKLQDIRMAVLNNEEVLAAALNDINRRLLELENLSNQ